MLFTQYPRDKTIFLIAVTQTDHNTCEDNYNNC